MCIRDSREPRREAPRGDRLLHHRHVPPRTPHSLNDVVITAPFKDELHDLSVVAHTGPVLVRSSDTDVPPLRSEDRRPGRSTNYPERGVPPTRTIGTTNGYSPPTGTVYL